MQKWTEPPRCQRCDAPLTGQAVGGLCANCLLKLALELPAEPTAMVAELSHASAQPMSARPFGDHERVEETGDVTAAPREAVGSRIGRYKLLQEIGEGGFGIVYLADQMEPVKRRVALKVLKPGMDTREVVARFEAERQALALMDHPNIARVFDGGATESGRPYFVMELVKGIPLTKYCDDQPTHHPPAARSVPRCARGRAARASERDHPPRPQAVEHPRLPARRPAGHQGHRLRHRQSHQPGTHRQDALHRLTGR